MNLSKYNLTVTWMYPDLMSTYGDRGNVIVLEKRGAWRGLKITVLYHSIKSDSAELLKSDILFIGGAQDRQQKIVIEDLQKKAKTLKKLIENGVPGLFICGAYQFLGNYYKAADGTKIPGLEIFDVHTIHPGDQQQRIIGNIVTRWNSTHLVGFENHGGKTYLSRQMTPFATVVKGGGNNGEDGTEGVFYKNSIGTYLHGPILPKNPELADWLIKTALRIKYQKDIHLSPLDDELENKARDVMLRRMSISENQI